MGGRKEKADANVRMMAKLVLKRNEFGSKATSGTHNYQPVDSLRGIDCMEEENTNIYEGYMRPYSHVFHYIW